MKIISFLFRYSWRLMTLSLMTGLVAGVVNVGLFAIINSTLGNGGFATSTVVWSYVLLTLVLLVTRAASSMLLSYLAQNAAVEVRMQLSRQILSAPLRRLEEMGAPRLLTSLTNDVSVIAGGIMLIPTLCLQGTLLVGFMAYLAWLSWSIFLGVFVFIVVATALYQLAVNRAMAYIRHARELQDSLFSHFRSLTEGAKELKLHGERREAFLSELLEPTSHALRRNSVVGNAFFILAGSGGQIMVFVLIGLFLFGLSSVQRIDTHVLIGFAFTISYIVVPLEVITSMLPGLSSVNVALSKVESLGFNLRSAETPERREPAEEIPTRWMTLDLSEVTHTYYREGEGDAFTLGPLTLGFNAGELVFIVGGNGSGKTTFAKLLTGLYVPESGEIRLDGQPVTAGNREDYRQLFSVVFADFHLFESLLGLEPTRLDARARDYLVQLQLDHKVEVKDGRLSTTDLSQGQRKRLALLTAYLEDREIYFFDEWAADQDPSFKEIFYLQLLPELKAKGKTIFVITHDDRYYQLADRLIKLEDGKIDSARIAPADFCEPARLLAD